MMDYGLAAEREKTKNLWAIFGIFAYTVAAIILGPILNGYVLSILWKWFVVPAFGLREVSIPIAIGISLVVGFMTKQYIHDDSEAKERMLRNFAEIFLRPLIVLLMGWIVLHWM